MAAYIIDRRLSGKNKSTVNRQRFIRRYKSHIRRAVSDAVNKRSITDMERGESVSIPAEDIVEPTFHHAPGGKRTYVHPGNEEFATGDRVPRPQGGSGGGSGEGKASNSGEGMDEFTFQISRDEFLEFMFEDLALPNMLKKQLKQAEDFKFVRAGFTNQGTPAKLNIVRSLRSAHARRIALAGNSRQKIRDLKQELEDLQFQEPPLRDQVRIKDVEEEIAHLRHRINRIPFIDDFDLRYNHHVKQPFPSTSAVMFCLMDVSGSMTQAIKDVAKRFFLLLYFFIKRSYERIEVVFIRHHTTAKEVDEEEFFYSRESGGTVVSSALKLMDEIISERYSPSQWNIYGAQASDGDNWGDDSSICRQLLESRILPKMQYYAYIEITPREHQDLWYTYEELATRFADVFAMRQITEPGDIYPVFRDLFQQRVEA